MALKHSIGLTEIRLERERVEKLNAFFEKQTSAYEHPFTVLRNGFWYLKHSGSSSFEKVFFLAKSYWLWLDLSFWLDIDWVSAMKCTNILSQQAHTGLLLLELPVNKYTVNPQSKECTQDVSLFEVVYVPKQLGWLLDFAKVAHCVSPWLMLIHIAPMKVLHFTVIKKLKNNRYS